MKFTDGNWLLQPGVSAHYPAEAHDITQEGDALVVHAPTRPIRHRGDTLQGPLLTIRLDSPMEDVIKVGIVHFTGAIDRGPRIPLMPIKAPAVEIAKGEGETTLRSGKLSAHVRSKDGWDL